MPAKDALQSPTALAQEPQRDLHVPGRLRDLIGVSRLATEVYLSTEEAAQYVGRPSREAFIKWARRARIPLRRANGARRGPLVVRKGDLDFALRVR